METDDLIVVAAVAVVAFLLWRRMHSVAVAAPPRDRIAGTI